MKREKVFNTSTSNKPLISPLPMQYLGSKGRISTWILDAISERFTSVNHLVDLFAGSGAVSIEGISRGLTITANDIQPYSYCLLCALLYRDRDNLDALINLLESINSDEDLLQGKRNELRPNLKLEDKFFCGPINSNWENYAAFCDSTKILSDNAEVSSLKSRNNWNLMSKYYANTYFGIRQCLELDLIREVAEGLDEGSRIQLLGATISVMTFLVSSTTHLAQYLKISSEKTAQNLVKKRKESIIGEVVNRLKSLRTFVLDKDHTVLNRDYIDAIRAVPTVESTIIYADPPYFKEHYSRYYHLLDTFYFYDYPELSFNQRIGGITTGRYRKERIVSDFGLKSRVRGAFRNLFLESAKRKIPVALSYASTSLVEKNEVSEIAQLEGYSIEVFSKELMHSGQGQKRNKNVDEYLFLCKI